MERTRIKAIFFYINLCWLNCGIINILYHYLTKLNFKKQSFYAESILKNLYTEWFHLCDILDKSKTTMTENRLWLLRTRVRVDYKGAQAILGVMELFQILVLVQSTRFYASVKTQRTIYFKGWILQYVNYTLILKGFFI